MVPGFRFEIDPNSVQRIVPPSASERFEGVDFSQSGSIMGIATSETNKVLLFKRKSDGRFDDSPFQTIGRSRKGLDYPHERLVFEEWTARGGAAHWGDRDL